MVQIKATSRLPGPHHDADDRCGGRPEQCSHGAASVARAARTATRAATRVVLVRRLASMRRAATAAEAFLGTVAMFVYCRTRRLPSEKRPGREGGDGPNLGWPKTTAPFCISFVPGYRAMFPPT